MTIDELSALAARVPDLERRIAELEAANSKPAGPVFVTLKRASELTGVSVQQLRAWIKAGTLPASRRKRVWLVAIADVERIIHGLRAPATPPARQSIEDAADSIVARLPRRASR